MERSEEFGLVFYIRRIVWTTRAVEIVFDFPSSLLRGAWRYFWDAENFSGGCGHCRVIYLIWKLYGVIIGIDRIITPSLITRFGVKYIIRLHIYNKKF